MSFTHFTAAHRTTINWASGTSTELFIYPADGNFAERNFLYRISTATVEAEESTFTYFKGITRHLMILKGEIELIHEDRYTKHLKPFDQDVFSGEWSTRSKGKVTDFNLMLKAGATGSLTHHHLQPNSSKSFTTNNNHYFIYLASGSAAFGNGNTATAGDLIRIESNSALSLQVRDTSELVAIQVRLE